MTAAFRDPPELSDAAFAALASLSASKWGLVLSPQKRSVIVMRLKSRLAACQVDSFDAYVDRISTGGAEAEWAHVISALSTNVSSFFREKHHFDFIAQEFAPKARAAVDQGQSIRLWSAGCANGQEPYSMAMALLRAEPGLAGSDLRILASDFDAEVLGRARKGIYTTNMLGPVKPSDRKRFFDDIGNGQFRVKPILKQIVRFRELNLLDPWPMYRSFDGIFCRNVAIYFAAQTQATLWRRFASALKPDGFMCIGHAERLPDTIRDGFSSAGPTIFRHHGYTAGMVPSMERRRTSA